MPTSAMKKATTHPAGNSLQDAANSLLGLIMAQLPQARFAPHPLLGYYTVGENLHAKMDRKYWRGLSFALAINFSHIWRGIKRVWDRLERLDSDLRKASSMIGFLINPPPWTIFPSIVIGAFVLWWDVRRTRRPAPRRSPKAHMTIRHCHIEQVEAVFDHGEARLRHWNRLAELSPGRQ